MLKPTGLVIEFFQDVADAVLAFYFATGFAAIKLKLRARCGLLAAEEAVIQFLLAL